MSNSSVEVIKNRLYWSAVQNSPRSPGAKITSFNIDDVFVYEPFNNDFGPLNLANTYKYCRMLEDKLNDPGLVGHKLVQFTNSSKKNKVANSAYLMGAFMVIVKRVSAKEAFEPFSSYSFLPFRDASYGSCTYKMTILDALMGIEFAIKMGWFDYSKFDVDSYQFYERVENGDMHWVVPNKFLAFAGPSPTNIDPEGFAVCTPEHYVPIFKQAGITLVIRLNNKQYDRRRFTDAGIKHAELFFNDGSCPPKEIIEKFLQIVESEPGAIAIHCKAGLGRTGTLIGLYCMKHFGIPARAYIGWNRVCRPGSILGPQQEFLNEMENSFHQLYHADQIKILQSNTPTGKSPLKIELELTREQKAEDKGQGDRLTNAKKQSQSPKSTPNFSPASSPMSSLLSVPAENGSQFMTDVTPFSTPMNSTTVPPNLGSMFGLEKLT